MGGGGHTPVVVIVPRRVLDVQDGLARTTKGLQASGEGCLNFQQPARQLESLAAREAGHGELGTLLAPGKLLLAVAHLVEW